MLIDGKEISKLVLNDLINEIKIVTNKIKRPPSLNIILVGDNSASLTYVQSKLKKCSEIGINGNLIKQSKDVKDQDILILIERLNKDKKVDGIILQLPIPTHLNDRKLIETISPLKDVDGLTSTNIGLLSTGNPRFIPATAYGIMEILRKEKIVTQGKRIVVIGRSDIVGKPMVAMLSGKDENATVTLCHSKTVNLSDHTINADIVIVAVGKTNILTGSMIKDGAVVIDVGINRVKNENAVRGYNIVGDADLSSIKEKASLYTPVPGGVGPMTIAMLMKNVCEAAKLN
ncbi:MAG: bifunctional 5,10-methylenetetrahydrofolate dehydrogenase/5,10-methenyltetrahydrofolate cyclohydrolase [Dehalococcoidia bacterium]